MNRLEYLKRQNREVTTAFVFTEIQFGMTLCHLVANSRERRPERLALARQAFETAERYMWKVRLDHPDFNRMTAQCERLKFEIQSLGG